jgi:hypothetical protein
MSFFYNPRTKQPQIWTYPIFIVVTLGVLYGFFFYGEHKSRTHIKVDENAQSERTF